MAILLALVAALSYGISDFIGGVVSRRSSAWPVAVLGALTSGICCALAALVVPGEPSTADFGWAVLAGLGSGVGVGFLYRGFAGGRISVVAPVSAVGAALVPVVVGLVTGERPGALTLVGLVVAAPAIWLVASVQDDATDASTSSGLVDGVLAGLGFGSLFALLGQVPEGAGFWPTAVVQLVSVPVLMVLATALRTPWLPQSRVTWWAVAAGPFSAVANLLFLVSTQRGLLTVSSVLTSLYPASTVLLAVVFLRESVDRRQSAGLLLCAVTVALVVAG